MIYSKAFVYSRRAAEKLCVTHLYPVATPASLAQDGFKVMTASCCPNLLRLKMCATAPGGRIMCVVWRCLLGVESRQGLTCGRKHRKHFTTKPKVSS